MRDRRQKPAAPPEAHAPTEPAPAPRAAFDPERGFPSAQPRPQGQVGGVVRRIVDTVFLREDEMEAAFDRLTSELVIGEKRSDYGTVMAALDRAEDNARLAHRLAVTMKLEKDRFNLENESQVAAMRAEAKNHLEADKAEKKHTKQITDADVVAKAATLFPEEWQSVQEEGRRMEMAVRHTDHQVENWASRCRTLQVIASKLR